ncbi:MAG: sugar ABC transporter permease, partial [Pseudomonadota bacterium]
MRGLSRRAREGITDLWLTGPAVLAMLVLIVAPVLVVAAMSFTDYQVGAKRFAWIGWENYGRLLSDPIGRRAITNTLLYVAIVMPLSMGLGLLVALGLHGLGQWGGAWAPRLSNALKAAYFLPVAATLVAMAVAW